MGELNRVPVWKTLMGLKDGEDVGVLAGTPGLRAGLRKLFLEVERMMREELGAAGKKKGKYTTLKYDEWAKPFTLTKKFCFQEFLKREAAQQQKIEEKGEEKVEVKVEEKLEVLEEAQKEVVTEVKAEVKVDLQELERTYMWDPVRSVCLRLEIAQSKLSYLSKMYSGKSALEIADCIKAEGLKVYFWEHARNFVLTAHGSARAAFFDQKAWEKCYLQKRSFTGELIPVVGELDPEEIFAKNDPYSNWQEGLPALKKKFWSDWKAYKRAGTYDKEIWAHECGFSSYARMRKACMLTYDMTPQMLEMQVIEEIATYYSAKNTYNNRQMLLKGRNIPDEMRPQAPFNDDFEGAMMMQPEWMERMCGIFG